MAQTEFWIDVGGTFTDSFMRREDGRLAHYKVLSSGVIKGAVAGGSSSTLLVDPDRGRDPPELWTGFRVRLLDANGGVAAESTVSRFDATRGELHLALR